MRTKEPRKSESKRKTRKRILKSVLAIVVVLIALVVFLVPVFVSSEKGRKAILAKINSVIDGQMDFATLSMGWFKGLKVTGISFKDGSGRTSVKVKQIVTKPHYGSILTGGLSFGETIVDKPRVEINLKGRQTEKAKALRQGTSVGKRAQTIGLPIKKVDLVVNEGNLKVSGAKAETVEFSEINSRVNLRPPGQQTNFDIDMAVVDGAKESKISVAGQITPQRRTGWSLKGTSGDLTIEVNDLDVGSLGPIFALAGVEVQAKGRISVDLKSKIRDGKVENIDGTIKGRDLDVTSPGLAGDRLKTSRLDADIKLHRQKEMINVEKLRIQSDWAKLRITGTVPTTFRSLAEFLEANSNLKGSFECNVAALASQMPRTLGIKEGMEITSGQFSGNVETFTKNGQREIYGSGSLVGLAGVVGGKRIALSEPVRATVEITSHKTGVKFDRLDLSSAFCKINCTGSTELVKYNANVDLGKLQAELGQFIDIGPYRIAGEVFSKGTLSGDKKEINVVGSSVAKNLRVSSTDGTSAFEPMADISFSVVAEPASDIINVDFVKVSASFGQVSIKDAPLPLSKEAKKSLNLPISAKVDLQKLQPFVVLLASFPEEMQLAGVAESEISISSKKDSYRIVTDATKIKNLRLSYPGRQPFVQDQVLFVFDGDYSPTENNWAVRRLELISPDIKIKGDFEKDVQNGKTKLQGRLDCEYDWSAVSTVVGPFLPPGLKLEGKRKDTITFSSKYPTGQTEKLLANLNTKASLGFDRAHYMGLNLGPTDVNVQIKNGLMTIAPFSTRVNNGKFNFAGGIDFKQKPTLLRTPGPIEIIKDVQINDETTRKLLMYVNPIFANSFNVSGVANFSCERLAIPLAGANKDDIEVIGTISIRKLRLQTSDLLGQILSVAGTGLRGEEITVHPTRFVLQNGFIRYDDMQMDIGDNPVNFRGVIGLDKSLNMTVTLPYTLKGRTARVDKETVGRRITLPLRGTVDKPELDVKKLLEEQLKKELERQLGEKLREGLEGLFKK